jgi:hypothetical protein
MGGEDVKLGLQCMAKSGCKGGRERRGRCPAAAAAGCTRCTGVGRAWSELAGRLAAAAV